MLTTTRKQESFRGLRVLVVGLGRFGGGVGVTRWLASQKAHVTVTDQVGPEALAESVQAVADIDVTLHLGGHDPHDLDSTDLAVINPAVDKARSELFRAVVRRGIAWTTEMNLFCECCPGAVIGVTGTYGKSTVCAMLVDALEASRHAGGVGYTAVHLGGNIGRSLLPSLHAIRPTDLVVLEMSNAQLEDLPRITWAPWIAVIGNVFPHHLDRYGSYADYVASKLNIVGPPEQTRSVIVGDMDAEAEAILQHSVIDASDRVVRVHQAERPVALRIPGEHNQANAACVLAVCRQLGLDETVVRDALRLFRGLPHRLEHVRVLDGVDYYNDSKSTSPATTVRAVEAFSRPIVAIVGGQDKCVSLAACAESLASACRRVICIGASGPAFARAVRAAVRAADQDLVREAENLTEAVRIARAEAHPGDAVLFSPGAPSFDAYVNFVDRGRCFVDVVRKLS